MAQQIIGLGSVPDDGTGDTLRAGGDKINDNFTEVYTAIAGMQPIDSDLSAIAALATTAYGRSLLTLANAAALAAEVDSFFLTPAEGNAAYQPIDSDLTAIAALSTTSYGQSLLTLANQAALQAEAAGGGREIVSTDRIYYVRNDGNDSNTGLTNDAGGAFQTIMHAVREVTNNIDIHWPAHVYIKVADGTYPEFIRLTPYIVHVPTGRLSTTNYHEGVTLEGNRINPENCIIKPSGDWQSESTLFEASVLSLRGAARWTVVGFEIDTRDTTTPGNFAECIFVTTGGDFNGFHLRLFPRDIVVNAPSGSYAVVHSYIGANVKLQWCTLFLGGNYRPGRVLYCAYNSRMIVQDCTLSLTDNLDYSTRWPFHIFHGSSIDVLNTTTVLNGFTLTRGQGWVAGGSRYSEIEVDYDHTNVFWDSLVDPALAIVDVSSTVNGARGIRPKAGAVVASDLPYNTSQVIRDTVNTTFGLYQNLGGVLSSIKIDYTSNKLLASALKLGVESTITGQLSLSHASSAFLTTIQAGNAAAARTYTWSTNFGAAGTVLTDAAGDGTLSWGVILGRHTVGASAGTLFPATTNGCAALAQAETATNKINYKYLAFDAAAVEYAWLAIPTPKSYNASTVLMRAVWTHPATTTNFGVVWQFEIFSAANDDALDTALGTAVTVTDTGGTTQDFYQADVSAEITPSNTPAKQDWLFVRVGRLVSDGGDTMAVDAHLIGVEVYYTTNAATDN